MPWWRSAARRVVPEPDPHLVVATLSSVADRAVEQLPRISAFLATCASYDEPPAVVASEGHRLATEFYRLEAWVLDGPRVAELDELRAALLAHLRHCCTVVHVANRVAFPNVGLRPAARRHHELAGDDLPVRALGVVRDRLAELLRSAEAGD